MAMKMISITDIGDFKLGNAENSEKGTGCTVIICEEGAVGGVDVRGGGPATRETDLLRSENTVNAVNAVVLSGGSAFGLEAASGVMRELADMKIGFDVGDDIVVPIVCGASLYDLPVGDHKAFPDVYMGAQAVRNAYAGSFARGNHGAGTGATVGKLKGYERAMKAGLGTFACGDGIIEVGAIAAVNAVGDIYNGAGKIIAGLRSEDGRTIYGTIKTLKGMVHDKIRLVDDSTSFINRSEVEEALAAAAKQYEEEAAAEAAKATAAEEVPEEPAEEVAEEVIEEPAAEAVEEPSEEFFEEPSEEISEEPAEESSEEAEETAEEAVPESAEAEAEVVVVPEEEPSEEIFEEPEEEVFEDAEEAEEEVTEESFEEYAEESSPEIVEEEADTYTAYQEEQEEEDVEEPVEEFIPETPAVNSVDEYYRGYDEVSIPVAEPEPESFEEPVCEPEEETFEEPAEEIIEEAPEEAAEDLPEEIPEEPAEEVIEEPAEEYAEEPSPEFVEEEAEVFETPEEEPAEEIIEEPAEEVIEEPAEEIVEEEEPVVLTREDMGYDIVFNTTISCLITNAALTKSQANKLASILHDAYARAIKPVHGTLDGDTVFVLATGKQPVNFDAFAALATDVMQYAIIDGAMSAEGAYGLPSARDM